MDVNCGMSNVLMRFFSSSIVSVLVDEIHPFNVCFVISKTIFSLSDFGMKWAGLVLPS